MTTTDDANPKNPDTPIRDPRGTRALWAAALGTPALFGLHLAVTFGLLPVLCRHGKVWVLHVITGVSLTLCALGIGVAAREWSRLASRKPLPADDPDELGRAQFLAVLGTITATFFFVVILAAGIPPIIVDPCQD